VKIPPKRIVNSNATDHDRPVERHPDRHRVAGDDAEQTADEREDADLRRLRVDGLFDLVEGRRRVDVEVREAAALQVRDRLGHAGRSFKDAEQGRHQ
jgi:hypothetical protein